MKTFSRDQIETHCAGVEWPEFLGSIKLGESFVVETERFNRVNGPIAIDGIKAGVPGDEEAGGGPNRWVNQ
jgi:hypothetical protein